MDILDLGDSEVYLYLALSNFLLGGLFGFFPLLAGIKMKNRKYGVAGFIGSVFGGAVAGVFLAFPVAAVLTWMILKDLHVTPDPDGEVHASIGPDDASNESGDAGDGGGDGGGD